ncbi:transmembrane protein 34 [Coccidioides immitis RMSCC 3703]|uniref:Transmembrane protein 34 n=1 Tax=Coccidioides immitis RMSCC 3703 TaxID=454286 RepID=A0A0J8QZ44_COCIT|nr:transmembrane protein 34 [Coccidioides immitis RMSCC 3703]
MSTMEFRALSGGTGSSLARATVIVAGVASLIASLLSIVSIWLQLKNYRKPLLQRYVVRILLIFRVPIYSVSSWTSIISLQASSWTAPIRDIYEAFTIYTFFQLLINFLGGERALIIMTHGRPPVQHTWPLNQCLSKVDISDPLTFLAIKRGILQYVWLKPILTVIAIILKATGTYQEGYLGLSSGYLWTGIVYNISVTVSLYSLALFWVCMHDDLRPFRPVPKFLCVKLVIFASYWQGFFLSILQWLGALSNGPLGYTPDNLAAAIQDSLICFEMPIFAVFHWYAFSWHDYADPTISAARMPIIYALRDAFGIKDLIQDSKETFRGENYEYRKFDSGDNVIARSRVMDGMRYDEVERQNTGFPDPDKQIVERHCYNRHPAGENLYPGQEETAGVTFANCDEITLDDEDERLFTNARALEFGDWHYPVITANEVPRDQLLPSRSRSFTAIKYQHPPEGNQVKRSSRHRCRRIQGEGSQEPSADSIAKKPRRTRRSRQNVESGSSSNPKPTNDQLVDIVDDVESADKERGRARAAGKESHHLAESRLISRSSSGTLVQKDGPNETEAGPSTSLPGEDDDSQDERQRLLGHIEDGIFNEERAAWG